MVVKPGDTNQEVLNARQEKLDATIEHIDAHILEEAYEKSDTHVIYIGESGYFYPFNDWAHDELVNQYKNCGWKYVTVYTEKILGSPPGRSLNLYLSTQSRRYVPFARDYNGKAEKEWIRGKKRVSYHGVEHEAGDTLKWEKPPRDWGEPPSVEDLLKAVVFWALVMAVAFLVL